MSHHLQVLKDRFASFLEKHGDADSKRFWASLADPASIGVVDFTGAAHAESFADWLRAHDLPARVAILDASHGNTDATLSANRLVYLLPAFKLVPAETLEAIESLSTGRGEEDACWVFVSEGEAAPEDEASQLRLMGNLSGTSAAVSELAAAGMFRWSREPASVAPEFLEALERWVAQRPDSLHMEAFRMLVAVQRIGDSLANSEEAEASAESEPPHLQLCADLAKLSTRLSALVIEEQARTGRRIDTSVGLLEQDLGRVADIWGRANGRSAATTAAKAVLQRELQRTVSAWCENLAGSLANARESFEQEARSLVCQVDWAFVVTRLGGKGESINPSKDILGSLELFSLDPARAASKAGHPTFRKGNGGPWVTFVPMLAGALLGGVGSLVLHLPKWIVAACGIAGGGIGYKLGMSRNSNAAVESLREDVRRHSRKLCNEIGRDLSGRIDRDGRSVRERIQTELASLREGLMREGAARPTVDLARQDESERAASELNAIRDAIIAVIPAK